MRVIICGGRDYSDWRAFNSILDGILPLDEMKMPVGVTIIHGGCPTGADAMADRYGAMKGCEVVPFPAEWTKHGRAAGPIRNQQMLDQGKPDFVVAFPGGRGTADMVRRARAAGVEVIVAALRRA